MMELLVSVGIIAILAGLVTPAVISTQQQGRITQAKGDMTAILVALKGLEGTYGKMVAKRAEAGLPVYHIGGENNAWVVDEFNGVAKNVRLDSPKDETTKAQYYAFIAELSDPSNQVFTGTAPVSVNKRRIMFLGPKSEYNPAKRYDDITNKKHLWLDPWGNPYVILINVDGTDQIVDPTDNTKLVAAKVILYSYGPDGESGTDATNRDNVCSWKNAWK